MNTLELDHQLNTLIIQGKSADAFQKFYAENVVAQENDDPERVGRDQWMRSRADVEKNMKKFDARLTSTTRHLTRPRASTLAAFGRRCP